MVKIKKVLYISLTVLFLVGCASSIEVRMDGLTGERIVETPKFKLASASTANLFAGQEFFEGIPLTYCKFIYKNNKKYLVIDYVPAYLSTYANLAMWGGGGKSMIETLDEYEIKKGYSLQMRLDNELIEIKAENSATSGDTFFMPPVSYDVTDIDFSKGPISYIRTQITYGLTLGEVGGEIKPSAAKKLQKIYSDFENAIAPNK